MKSPVDVLYLIGQLSLGGSEQQLLLLIKHLDRARFRPTVICLSEQATLAEALQALDCPTFVLRRSTDGRLKTLLRACLLTRQMRPGVLHSFGYASRAGLIASTVSGTSLNVLSIRRNPQWASRWTWWFYRVAIYWADAVLANSRQAVWSLSSRGLIPRSEPRVIYNGLDLVSFDKLSGNGCASKNDGQTICLVSNLRPPKCPDNLLRAFAIVLGSAPRTRLWIVGDGSLRDSLEQLAQHLGVQDQVVFWGIRSDVPALLRQATIGVNSSQNEGFPNAIIEYMAARLPVVATNVGGTPELVIDGETGILVPPDNPAAMADALLSLLRSPDVARRMGAAGRRRIEEHFTIERMVKETEAVYDALLNQGSLG